MTTRVNMIPLIYALVLFGIASCKKDANTTKTTEKLFVEIDASVSGVNFVNQIIETEEFNYYNYIYAYNGGGVATADFNNDGLLDLFFTANISGSKLYVNKGNFKFQDITATSNIENKEGFDTGAAIVDINNDGYADIYVCRAGWFNDPKKLKNLLYINNKDLTFTEAAADYGLADENRTISATFFDYDNDGDLDVYLANAPITTKDYKTIQDLKVVAADPKTPTLLGSDKLYRNNGANNFEDVSIKAGIFPDKAFGLNPQVGDLNNDGWLDIYVSNDFNMPDFAYMNNGDGTFSDKREELLKHMSFYSMGSDIADINNDGSNDMVVLDMNPEDYIRSKTTMSMTPISKFWEMLDKGYHYQYMHNVLQLNNNNGTFSEMANMSGIANTDWSWAPLLADFDLDGYVDLYVTNGVYRDVIDKDSNRNILYQIRKKGKKPTPIEYLEYTQKLPQQKLTNYFFKNNGDLTFSNNSTEWADIKPTFSNGAVYADLDNDGDLDIITNNINDEATLFKNNAIELDKGNYVHFQFTGTKKNRNGIGTKVTLYFEDGSLQTRQLITSRGYLSSGSNKVHFGFSKKARIRKAMIQWTDGKVQQLDIEPNQLHHIKYEDATVVNNKTQTITKLFKEAEFNFKHIDSVFNDFQIQLLLPQKLSQLGPAVATTDVNNDGIDDLYLGGGYSQSGQLLLGTPNGTFINKEVVDFLSDSKHEDIGAAFFDADSDGDQDLYVVSGSYEFGEKNQLLEDRLYINDGNGHFVRDYGALPFFNESGSVVVPADYDADGDMDLFVGGRQVPGKYPSPPVSYILENRKGKFSIVTKQIAPDLERIGMVTDAKWEDIDIDGDLDLIVTGEWMGIEVFTNKEGVLLKEEKYGNLSNTVGWWNKIHVEDVDGDGDKDIIAGNFGLNSKHRATKKKPFHVYAKDFDDNGTVDIFLAKYYKDKQVPVRGKSCTTQQMPYIKEKIKTYQEFAGSDIQGILGVNIDKALHLEATEFRSGVFLNDGGNNFEFDPFPNTCQTAPINSILFDDYDDDGFKDMLLAGNNHQLEIETTRSDAGIGVFLKGNANGEFTYITNNNTGFFADKDVRNIIAITTLKGEGVLVINNNGEHQLFLTK